MQSHAYYDVFCKYCSDAGKDAFDSCETDVEKNEFLKTIESGIRGVYERVMTTELSELEKQHEKDKALELLKQQGNTSHPISKSLGNAICCKMPPTETVIISAQNYLKQIAVRPSLSDLKLEYKHNAAMLRSQSQTKHKQTFNSNTRPQSRNTTTTTLRDVTVSELQLFKMMRGCKFTGTVSVDAVGVASIQAVLKDSKGDIIEVAFYNQLTSSDVSTEDARQLYPIGTVLTILEPYYKVFRNGRVGLRVENSSDVVIQLSKSISDLNTTKTDINKLITSGRKEYRLALTRYSQLLSTCYGDFNFCWKRLSDAFVVKNNVESGVREIAQSMLSNMSLCAVQLSLYSHAIYYCLESLGLFSDLKFRCDKSQRVLYRLALSFTAVCDFESAKSVIDVAYQYCSSSQISPFDNLRKTMLYSKDLRDNGPQLGTHYAIKDNQVIFSCPETDLQQTKVLFPQWNSSSIFVGKNSQDKGRGVIAKKFIKKQTIILIDRSLVSSTTTNKESKSVTSQNDNEKLCIDGCALDLVGKLSFSVSQDGEISRISKNLYFGDNLQNSSPTFNDLRYCFSFEKAQEIVRPTSWEDSNRLRKIISYNSFGEQGLNDSVSNMLYPAVSMFNHSSSPTASVVSVISPTFGEVAVGVITSEDINEGSEICISYTSNSNSLEKWGIPENC